MSSITKHQPPEQCSNRGAEVPSAASELSVYYDGGCPLCRAEIASYQRTEGGESLRWIDANTCGAAELGPDLEPATALARLHVRRADGTLLQGAAAFAEIWSRLPRWRWLSNLARLPGVLAVLEVMYTVFLRVRPLWRGRSIAASSATAANDRISRDLMRALRTDHAGEAGAVMIYRGVLAVSRDPGLRAFALHHLDTEQRHLRLIESIVPPPARSRLLPIWRLSGWLTGALPALFGARAVYATIEAVETFVDRHYEAQIRKIDQDGRQDLADLSTLLQQCQADEVAHRNDARARWDGKSGVLLKVWLWLVRQGSEKAVWVSRYA